MIEDVKEMLEYYESIGDFEKVADCENLLIAYYSMKFTFNDFLEIKKISQQNQIRKNIGEFALY